MDVFEDFHRKGIINKNINSIFIAPIGKKEKCLKTFDYRPISLITSLYKIIAKTLATKLKITLKETIVDNQMAFIESRQITDAILIANEVVDYWKVKKAKGFVPKLNIEKTFDTINWSFIDYMLEMKGPLRWRRWVRACINNVHYCIIINGRIKSTRGIRQWDPISPFIFIIAMDYLSRLLNYLKRKVITGVVINENCSFHHLLFADDILVFVKDDDACSKNLQMALSLFELAFGLKINVAKSIISPVNVAFCKTKKCCKTMGVLLNKTSLSLI